jgi:hypothetical protein
LRTPLDDAPELREALVLPFAQAREGAGEAVRLLRVLEARLARDTVTSASADRPGSGSRRCCSRSPGWATTRSPPARRSGHRRAQPDLPRPGPAPGHAAAALVRHVRHRRARALPRRAGDRGAAGHAGRVPALAYPKPSQPPGSPASGETRRSRRGASPDGRAGRADDGRPPIAPVGSRC